MVLTNQQNTAPVELLMPHKTVRTKGIKTQFDTQ